MYSHRRRRPRGGLGCGASLLLEKYRSVLDGGEYELEECVGDRHTVLRWLVRAAQLKSCPRSSTIPQSVHLRSNLADIVENINALRVPMSPSSVDALESQVAVWVMRSSLPVHVVTYLAWFFYRYRVYCRVHSFPLLECDMVDIPWLSLDAVERALVIPDVRKLAFRIFTECELRAGELEWGGSIGTLSVTSVDNVLQVFRTAEYVGLARSTLTYGTATRIYEQGLLPYVVLSMVDIRLRSRVQLPWVDKCVRSMQNLSHRLPPWPVVVVSGGTFLCVYKDHRSSSGCMLETVRTWFGACIHVMKAELDGRWDISSLTI